MVFDSDFGAWLMRGGLVRVFVFLGLKTLKTLKTNSYLAHNSKNFKT